VRERKLRRVVGNVVIGGVLMQSTVRCASQHFATGVKHLFTTPPIRIPVWLDITWDLLDLNSAESISPPADQSTQTVASPER
jgi:hypothetical protein